MVFRDRSLAAFHCAPLYTRSLPILHAVHQPYSRILACAYNMQLIRRGVYQILSYWALRLRAMSLNLFRQPPPWDANSYGALLHPSRKLARGLRPTNRTRQIPADDGTHDECLPPFPPYSGVNSQLLPSSHSSPPRATPFTTSSRLAMASRLQTCLSPFHEGVARGYGTAAPAGVVIRKFRSATRSGWV